MEWYADCRIPTHLQVCNTLALRPLIFLLFRHKMCVYLLDNRFYRHISGPKESQRNYRRRTRLNIKKQILRNTSDSSVVDLSPIFFVFRRFLVKIMPNNRLTPSGLAPSSGKSWISHCFIIYFTTSG